MNQSSISAGFRAAFRGPGLVLAEIAWRWCFGIAAWLLIVLTCREYLASVRFNDNDWLLIRTRQPFLIAEAVAHALQGSGARLIKAGIIVAVALVVFWIFAASVGRAATLKALLEKQQKAGFGSLVGISFFRAALALATLVGFFGAAILVGYTAPRDPADTSGMMATVLLFLAFGVVVAFLWSVLNWFLSVAPIFVLRDGRDTFGAIADSVNFFRRRAGPLTGVTLLFDLFRLVLLIAATLVVLAPVGSIAHASELRGAFWFALFVALIYFAIADFLYITRLAAYVSLAEEDAEPELPPVPGEPAAPIAAPIGPNPVS
jgi:hypothetical protein